ARSPRLAQREPAPLALEPTGRDARELGGQPRRNPRRRVGARVVGDDDPPGPREGVVLGKEGVQVANAALEGRLLVVDGTDGLDGGGGGRGAVAVERRRGGGGHAGKVGLADERRVGSR